MPTLRESWVSGRPARRAGAIWGKGMRKLLFYLLAVVMLPLACVSPGELAQAPEPAFTSRALPTAPVELTPESARTRQPVTRTPWLSPTPDLEPRPPSPVHDWPTSTPEEQGIDSELLADMLAAMLEHDHRIDGLLVVRHGHLVLAAYRYPYREDSLHVIHSCTKSVVSALVGIAIDRGHIEGVDQRVLDLLPGRTVANLDEKKSQMTLEDLLTMTTGLECRDSYLYRWSGLNEMRRSADWVQFILDLPMAEKPGTRFEYCNGASFLLSAILQETTGMNALAFAHEHLFGPLGINGVEWPSNPQGIATGWGGLQMHPRDMAKFGLLYLQGGQWGDRHLVPADWVEASTRKHVPATLQDGYGYQWWIAENGVYMALGYAGQFIFVSPDLDMVVVAVSDLEERDFYGPQNLLNEYIIPAADSSPLPPNPAGILRLQSLVEELAAP
jgi:CubicO group peptidase (beta-lactamase class C family)